MPRLPISNIDFSCDYLTAIVTHLLENVCLMMERLHSVLKVFWIEHVRMSEVAKELRGVDVFNSYKVTFPT